MIRSLFLTPVERQALLKVARGRMEFHGAGVRANAILLLDKGWSCEEISEAFFLDDDTVREFYKRYGEGGLDHLITYDWKGRPPLLKSEQQEQLSQWIEAEFPANTAVILAYIAVNFGIKYSHSGVLSLLHRLNFTYIRPKHLPQEVSEARQEAFIAAYEALLRRQDPDEVILFADAVHPEHQSRPSCGWARQGEKIGLRANSGRQRLNIHAAFELETGRFTAHQPETVNAQSTFILFQQLEAAYPNKHIHLFLDNARYHHAKALKQWLNSPNCRIKLHFLPPYCPHLNPIERLWGLMHKNVTHNRNYRKFKEFKEEIDDFFGQKLPKNWNKWRNIVSDNFRVIKLDNFRVLN